MVKLEVDIELILSHVVHMPVKFVYSLGN
jgi:hypothetical protein